MTVVSTAGRVTLPSLPMTAGLELVRDNAGTIFPLGRNDNILQDGLRNLHRVQVRLQQILDGIIKVKLRQDRPAVGIDRK